MIVTLIRPLKINGLFLVQNFPKLNARAKTKQAGKNKNPMCIQSIGLVQALIGNKTIYTSEKAKICTFYYSGTMILIKK